MKSGRSIRFNHTKMTNQVVYYFSRRTYFIMSLFILSLSIGLVYFAVEFYSDAWQYWLLIAGPSLVIIITIPEYVRTGYFLISKKPALELTTEQLIDHFKRKRYKWSDISAIELRMNKGKALGEHIEIKLTTSEGALAIAPVRLQGKKYDILDELSRFHEKYGNAKKGISNFSSS